MSVKKTDPNLNRHENVWKCDGYYMIVTPPLHNGLSFALLYDATDTAIAKLNKPMSLEERQGYAREFIEAINEK